VTPSQSGAGAGSRIQAPTARQAVPPDEASWAIPLPDAAAAPGPETVPAPAPAPAPEGAPAPERAEPALFAESSPSRRPGASEQVAQQVSRLAAELSGTQQRADERFAAAEARLAEVEALSADVGALEHKLNEVGRAQVVFQDALTSHPLRSAPRSLEQLRGELSTVRSMLADLDAKVQELQALPTVMEEVAARQFERLVSEMLSLPVDIEGLYREMDSIAERVTAREDTAALTAERVGFVAEAVVAMRQELDRVVGSLAEIRDAQAEDRAWRDGLERRMAALESPGAELQRLYQALASVVGGPGGRGAAAQAANGRAPGAALPAESQRAVEVLQAELDRIRQSIDVLAGPAPADDRADPLEH
jgi:predicted  nucleic acid-binding Zn-ribbon protein